jgi:hypothetical protein
MEAKPYVCRHSYEFKLNHSGVECAEVEKSETLKLEARKWKYKTIIRDYEGKYRVFLNCA